MRFFVVVISSTESFFVVVKRNIWFLAKFSLHQVASPGIGEERNAPDEKVFNKTFNANTTV